jgi:hypothetical protein
MPTRTAPISASRNSWANISCSPRNPPTAMCRLRTKAWSSTLTRFGPCFAETRTSLQARGPRCFLCPSPMWSRVGAWGCGGILGLVYTASPRLSRTRHSHIASTHHRMVIRPTSNTCPSCSRNTGIGWTAAQISRPERLIIIRFACSEARF